MFELKRQCLREARLSFRQRKIFVNTALFFFMVVVFFPLTLPPDPRLLRTLAPGLIWIAMLLAFFVSSESLFQQEEEDGVLEQWRLSNTPMFVFVMAKTLVGLVFNVGSMLFFLPLFALLFKLTPYETLVLALSLVVGCPALFSLCTLSAAFGLGLKQKGSLMALILFPFTLPMMVFGSATTTAAMQGLPIQGYMALLLAMSLLTLFLLPFITANVLGLSADQF